MLPFSYSAANLLARRLRTSLTVSVIALVVIASTLLLSLISSLERTLVSSADPRNLIVMSKGASNDGVSALNLTALQDLRFLEGIDLDAQGQPLISPELVVNAFIEAGDGTSQAAVVRGIRPGVAMDVHGSIRLLAGRQMRAAAGEALIGVQVIGRYRGAQLGDELMFAKRPWKVVGILESDGSSYEGEVWVDGSELQAVARYESPYSSIRIRTRPDSDREALARRIDTMPVHMLQAQAELAYYRKQAESASTLHVLVWGLAVLASVAAALGAVNTLYASVSARTKEIGTLRALGFSRGAILFSFMIESMLMSTTGFVLGSLTAWLLAEAISAGLGGIGFASAAFSTSLVRFEVGTRDLLAALGLATAVGALGGLAPARYAANLRPLEALRKT
jgi:putative ABC transport system permease protein